MTEKGPKKSPMRNITINIPDIYDENIQMLIKMKLVASRSEAIRTALREYLHREYGENLNLLGFSKNKVKGHGGGGGLNNRMSSPVLTNCTFVDNKAEPIYVKGKSGQESATHPIVTNSILWNNTSSQIVLKDASITISYCDIEGGQDAISNTNGNLRMGSWVNIIEKLSKKSKCGHFGNFECNKIHISRWENSHLNKK